MAEQRTIPMPRAQACALDSFALQMTSTDAGQGHLLRRQRLRRATILAAARRVLADGADQFTLRRVAQECAISVQTLRNGFGRREDLLVAAFNDHTSAVWRTLSQFSSGPCLFLDLARIYHRCAVDNPQFLRAMVISAMASPRSLTSAQRHGASIKSVHLRAMAKGEMLRPGIDAEALAAHITRLNTFMMYEWTQGGDPGDLMRDMIGGNRMLLMGALTPAAAAAVEAWPGAGVTPA